MAAAVTVTVTVISLLLLSSLRPAAAQPPDPARDPYGYARVTPSMAIIIIILIAAIFIMGFFSIYIRRRASQFSAVGPGAAAARTRRAAASRGLDRAVIETFPTMVYSAVKGMKIGKEDLECAVCLNEFDDDETLRLIPKCDHVFHPECIDAWLEYHTTCPVCRANLTPQPGDSPSPAAAAMSQPASDSESISPESDLEAGRENGAVSERECEEQAINAVNVERVLNRNRTRGSRSGRPRKFPRSHSTGHSLVQPGENTDRFTLRLPTDVRKRLMSNQELNRTMSLIALPREGSTRRGYRIGGEGGKNNSSSYKRLEPLETEGKMNRWKSFSRTSSFLARASSFLTRTTSSVRSPRVNGGSIRSPRVRNNEEGGPSGRQDATQSVRPAV